MIYTNVRVGRNDIELDGDAYMATVFFLSSMHMYLLWVYSSRWSKYAHRVCTLSREGLPSVARVTEAIKISFDWRIN
jgi:hypothetical protein